MFVLPYPGTRDPAFIDITKLSGKKMLSRGEVDSGHGLRGYGKGVLVGEAWWWEGAWQQVCTDTYSSTERGLEPDWPANFKASIIVIYFLWNALLHKYSTAFHSDTTGGDQVFKCTSLQETFHIRTTTSSKSE